MKNKTVSIKRGPQHKPLKLSQVERSLAVSQSRKAFVDLETAAKNGDNSAKEEIKRLQRVLSWDFEERIWANIREGTADVMEIHDLIRMADFAIPRLLWLAKKHPEKLRRFAHRRLTWPGYFGRNAMLEEDYKRLLGSYNKAGEWTDLGPLEIAKELPFQLNRKTKNGILLNAAIKAIQHLMIDRLDSTSSYFLVRFAPKVCGSDDSEKNRSAARAFIESLGEFTEANWDKWKPVLIHVVTIMYGPIGDRRELLPASVEDANTKRHWGNFLTELLNATPIHCMTEHPEIRDICRRKKTESGRWNEIKNQILRRCHSLTAKSP